MKTYKQFIKESSVSIVPVASIHTTGTDVSIPHIRNELNRNLSLVLRQSFETVGEALVKINKILNMYGLSIPQIDTYDIPQDNLEIPVSPVLHWDELSGNVTVPKTFILSLSFKLDQGLYKCFAELHE